MHFKTSFIPFLCLITRTIAFRTGCGDLHDVCCEGPNHYPCFPVSDIGGCAGNEEHLCCEEFNEDRLRASGCKNYPTVAVPQSQKNPVGFCHAKDDKCSEQSEGLPSNPASPSPDATAEIETGQAIEPASIDPENNFLETASDDAATWEAEADDAAFMPFDSPAKRKH